MEAMGRGVANDLAETDPPWLVQESSNFSGHRHLPGKWVMGDRYLIGSLEPVFTTFGTYQIPGTIGKASNRISPQVLCHLWAYSIVTKSSLRNFFMMEVTSCTMTLATSRLFFAMARALSQPPSLSPSSPPSFVFVN